MNLKQISASLLTLATVTALPVIAAAPSGNQTKVAQCNRIIAIANTAVKAAKSVTNSGQPPSTQAMLRAANAIGSAAGQIEKLSLTDRRLQGYQSRFVALYRQTSKATRNFVNAYNRHDRSAIESAFKAIQVATNPEKQLVAGINNYCLR